MNWDAAAAIADWLGLALVVGSLVYVALQIRQNTDTVKAATELETARLWSEFHGRAAHSPDMVDIWDQGLTDPDSLTPTEKRRFIWFVAEYFYIVENLYRQRHRGYLSRESWEQHENAVAGLLAHPVIQRWWLSGVSPYSDSFRRSVDRARENADHKSWKYSPIAGL